MSTMTRGLMALVMSLSLACGDDDGPTPPEDGGGTLDGGVGDGGTVDGGPRDGALEDATVTDAFVTPACELITCENGTCSDESGIGVCTCDPAWRGEACDELDAPAAADTVLWLDASASESLLASGGTVSAWSDLSPSGADFTQGAGARQPMLGTIGDRAALVFDGVDDELRAPGYEGLTGVPRYTLFFVVSVRSGDAVFSGYGGGEPRIGLIDSGDEYGLAALHAGGVSATINASGFTGEQVYERERVHVVTVQRTPVSMSLWVDGRFRQIFPATGPENVVGALELVLGGDEEGGTTPLQGRVGEVLAFDDALAIADRERVERYLGAKWLGAAVAHDESSFGNLQVWLDASNPDSVMIEGGGVFGWDNLAGEQDFFSPTEATQPVYVADGLNGRGVLRFDGEDDTIRNAFPQTWLAGPGYTVVAIAVPRAPSSDQTSLIVSANDETLNIPGMGLGIRDLGATVELRHKAPANVGGFGDTVAVSGGTASAPILAMATWNASSMRLETGAGVQMRAPTQAEHGALYFYVGSHNNAASSVDNFSGDVAEVLVFLHELSFAERTALRAMLEAKWGL